MPPGHPDRPRPTFHVSAMYARWLVATVDHGPGRHCRGSMMHGTGRRGRPAAEAWVNRRCLRQVSLPGRRDGQPDTCVHCCRRPEATCSRCGQRRPCAPAAAGRPAHRMPRLTAACARCGQDRPSATRWPEGPACASCHTCGPCASGSRARRTAAPAGRPPGPAADTCVWRAGIPASSACAEGGPEDKLYEKGCCPRCSLRRRAQQLQAGVPETTRPPANPSLASP
jgi:hypothetical protein